METLLTRREAAAILKLKVQTLAKWAMDGKHLPVVKVGRTVRYRRTDIDKLVERGSIPSA